MFSVCLVGLVLAVGVNPAQADVRYVDDDAPPTGDGQSWTTPYDDLQDALTEALGDPSIIEIHVAGGTYYPSEQSEPGTPRTERFRLINGVTISGGYAGLADPVNPDVRDLELYESSLSGDIGAQGDDSDNCYHVFYHPEGLNLDETAVLDGFTITAGNANGSGSHRLGGGMFNSDCSPMVTNCTFSGNRVYGGGGGVLCHDNSSPTLTNCTISGNSAVMIGGGVLCRDNSSPTLTNCTISGNLAHFRGGGVYCYSISASRSSPTLTNCTISGNLAHSSGGVYCGDNSSPTLTNCILWGDTPQEIVVSSGGSVLSYCCDVQGGWSGEGIIDTDPLFVDPGHWDDNGTPGDPYDDYWVDGDYHLQPDSPCINLGNNDAVPVDISTDFEGDDRIQQCRVDMGVDETPYIGPDCNTNGVADACDIEQGTSPDCNTNGVPDECDLAEGTSLDCNTNDVPDECDIDEGTSPDCNTNGVPDECDLAEGTSLDCNTNYVPDECDIDEGTSPDCNTNGVPDECDLAEGTSLDCNTNYVPDECDIDEGTSPDCNTNGVPDECDLSEGTSQDCNTNYVPDECEPGGLEDCNTNGTTDWCDIHDGTSQDYDLNGVPDECDPDCNVNGVPDACDIDCDTGNCGSHPLECGNSEDCNANGIPDACDIDEGTSPDCNANYVPDECEPGGLEDCNTNGAMDLCDIYDGTSQDCNANAVPDECDIATGTSSDINSNGVPDECEPPCASHEWIELLPSDSAGGDCFGYSLSISGDTALIGAPGGADWGAAYVFEFNGLSWHQVAEILAPEPFWLATFGESVSISGNLGVIGAPFAHRAYAYRRGVSGWYQEAELLPPYTSSGDMFGSSVTAEGDTLLVGSPGAVINGHRLGAVYVFRWQTGNWVLEDTLTASDGNLYDYFGYCVSLSGDTVVVGALCDDDNGESSGSAYVFRFNGSEWTEEAKLTASDGAAQEYFGTAACISENTVVIGKQTDAATGNGGCAYVFQYDGATWLEQAKLVSENGLSYERVRSVSLSDEIILMGASGGDDYGPGAAYEFRFQDGNWVEEARLTPSDSAGGDYFGLAAVVSGDNALVGAPRLDQWCLEIPGSVYAYRGIRNDCNSNGVIDLCDVADGTSGDCNTNAIPDECDIDEGFSTDLNQNGVPDECEDCNCNGIPDDLDIANGTSQDCNTNEIPDECDLAAGTSQDCNSNDVPDECDIASGSSPDGNSNGVPDECELCTAHESARLLASDGAAGDWFGYSVSISGNVAVVGASGDDDLGNGAGAAYVFRYNGSTWVEEAKLLASDGAAGDWFGCAVATSGDIAVIGAYYDDDLGIYSGSVYVFRFDGTTWNEEAKLTASDGADHNNFGCSVSLHGCTLVVGADYNSSCGATYVFRYDGSTWLEEAKLTASDGAPGDRFGFSVSVCGDTAVIGAKDDGDLGSESGSAYVFRFDGTAWNEETKLTASDGAADDYFGWSVSLAGNAIIIGAPRYWEITGAAYVFRFDGTAWAEEAKLVAAGGQPSRHFGWDVCILDDTALVGAPREAPMNSVHVFHFDGVGWTERGRLTAADGTAYDRFGRSVSLSGQTAIIGATELGGSSGSACIFDGLLDCNANSILDLCELQYGTADDVNSNGVIDSCELDCNSNGVFDYLDIINGTSIDCNDNGIPDECLDLEADCNTNAIPDECDIAEGSSIDCNNNGIPDECLDLEDDCNTNDIPDECDIAEGSSEDCNYNGIPDECDLATGTSQDANSNGIPDECEFDCVGNELVKLLASDGAMGDAFSYSLSISGDTAVIGAYGDDDLGEKSGAAYVFRFDGSAWIEEAKLTASDGVAGDEFGASVSISGDTAVIGSPFDDDLGHKSGSAYVFRFDGSNWVEVAKLTASDGEPWDAFGISVSVSGNIAGIGAYGEDDNGLNAGAAYVFRCYGSSWVMQAKLTASDAAEGNWFGASVSVSGDAALIGTWEDNGAGSAYVFRLYGSSWLEEAKLSASDGAEDDGFGVSLSLSGDTALIGAHGDDDLGIASGSAYVYWFNGTNWVEQAKLIASDGGSGDFFGWSVSLSDDNAVIGADGDDDNGGSSGSAYVFRSNGPGWVEQTKLTASDGAAYDLFGYSVAISGDTAVCGAYWDDDNGGGSGSAYVFRGLSDCNSNDVSDICDVADGTSADCNTNGIPDECDIADGTSQDANSNGIPDECEVPPVCPGDCNCDGDISWRDIEYLQAALESEQDWRDLFLPGTPTCSFDNNDVNADGIVNWRDVDPFVAVINTTCP